MAFASKVLYTGDAVTTDFNVPFPYISQTHVQVYVNDTLMLSGMNYNWSNSSTISFNDAPKQDDAIEIKRWTSPSDLLVDFVDGSTLRANDLDTAYLHNFYLSQEYADSWNELINEAFLRIASGTGIVETETDAVIAALVNEMLSDAAATTLQQRVTDIDNNAEAIIQLGSDLQIQINTLAEGVAADVYIQATEPVPGVGGVPNPILEGSRWYDSDDNNAPYIYQSGAWVSIQDPRIGQAVADISVLQTDVGGNTAAIVAEQVARSNADSAIASELALLGAQNGAQTAFILDTSTVKIDSDVGDTLATRLTALAAADSNNAAAITSEETARIDGDNANATSISNLTATVNGNSASITTNQSAIATAQGDITSLYAKYGVTLNVNGYVTGFAQNNDGTTGSFVILADKFAVVHPSGDPGETQIVPFQVVSGKVQFNSDVEVNGNLILNGTVVGAALVDGTIGATQIGANAITTDKINANAITAAKIAANQITATHIGASTVQALGITTGSLSVDGTLTMGTSGKMISSGAGFESGAGFFMGYDTSAYKFYVGNYSAGDYLSWDGTTLTVRGDLSIGTYTSSTTDVLLSAPTERFTTSLSWSEVKKFEINKPGQVRAYTDYKVTSTSGGSTGHSSEWRWKLDGSIQYSWAGFSTTWATTSYAITTTETSQYITLEYTSGERNPVEPVACGAHVRNTEIRALIDFGESVITD